jgi:hypothetical protein
LGALGFISTPGDLAAELVCVAGPAGLLDPACGDGVLLLAAWRAAGREPAFARRLFGLELDPERAREARRRLRVEIGGRAGDQAARQVRCRDALLAPESWPAGTAVAANPPWVSLSGRRRGALAPERAAAYRAAYPAMAGWPSLHGAFLERIARHVADERTVARVLVPESTCTGALYEPVRDAVMRRCGVRWIRRAAQGEFPGVIESAALLELAPALDSCTRCPPCDWTPERSNDDAELLAHLARFPRLPARAFADIGVHTGNSARLLVHRVTGSEPHDADVVPLREGRDLSAFRLGRPSTVLAIPHAPPADARYRIAALERHRAVPILVRQTADRPIAARHVEPAHFRNTLLACTPPPELACAAVLAVLNSDVAARFHRASFADARQAAFPQVKIRHLRALPFPWLGRAAAPERHAELAELGRALETADEPRLAALRAELDAAVRGAFGLGG